MDEIIHPEEEEMDEMFVKWDSMSQEEKVTHYKRKGLETFSTFFKIGE